MPRHRATPFALIAAAVAALAGCGGDGPYAPARGRTVSVRLDEYRVVPQRIAVTAGRVRFVARDTGRLTHNLAVVSFARPAPEQPEHVYGRTRTAHPGDVVRARIRLRPGRYRLVCTIGNHDNLGQYGELRVLPPT